MDAKKQSKELAKAGVKKIFASVFIIIILTTVGYFIYKNYLTASWKTYTGNGISIQYPSHLKIITDKDRKITEPTQYLGHTVLIANQEDRIKMTTSIQINIENTLQYEVPWSGGNIVTLNKNNLELFHLAGPEKITPAEISGRYTLKTQFVTNGLHTKVSILDNNRVVKINIDSKDETLTKFHDQILSTFIFTQ